MCSCFCNPLILCLSWMPITLHTPPYPQASLHSLTQTLPMLLQSPATGSLSWPLLAGHAFSFSALGTAYESLSPGAHRRQSQSLLPYTPSTQNASSHGGRTAQRFNRGFGLWLSWFQGSPLLLTSCVDHHGQLSFSRSWFPHL